MIKKTFYILSGLALLIGLWGLYDRLVFGHTNANYGSYVVWGLWVARPFWHVGLFPVQFPVFSLASGTALLMLLLALFAPDDPRRPQQLRALGLLSAALLVIKLYFMWADFSQSIYGNVPMNVEAVNQVLFGEYWWAFWILQVLLGSLIPLIVLFQPKLASQKVWAGAMGILLLVGCAVARALIIFPDTMYLERWEFHGSHPNNPFKVQPVRNPTITPLVPDVVVFGQETPMSLEAVLMGIAEEMELPGFGPGGCKDYGDFVHPDDLYIKMVANLGFGEKEDGSDGVPDADAEEMRISQGLMIADVICTHEPLSNRHS